MSDITLQYKDQAEAFVSTDGSVRAAYSNEAEGFIFEGLGNGGGGGSGTQGPPGTAATIQVGTVMTLPAGSNATVMNVGTSSAARFNFGIPAGADGNDGAHGTNGVNGTNGINGTNGADGKDGADGQDGTNGKSAYEIAVDNGFVGTEPQWLASLKGADGADGKDGVDGIDGVNQISADADNQITTGTDGGLFVPPVQGGGTGTVESVTAADGEDLIDVDNTDPAAPIIASTQALKDAVDEIGNKQDALTEGDNITIAGNVISADDMRYDDSDVWNNIGWLWDGKAEKGRYVYCPTPADVAEKNIDTWSIDLNNGLTILSVFFAETNIAENPTLTINGSAPLPISYRHAPAGPEMLFSRFNHHLRYMGDRWELENPPVHVAGYIPVGISSAAVNELVKACSIEDHDPIKSLALFGVVFDMDNEADSPALNVNGTGARPIYYGGRPISAGMLGQGIIHLFRYDGYVGYHLLNPAHSGIAEDSERLGGEPPEYYATQEEMEAAVGEARFAVNAPDYANYITAVASISTDMGNPSSYTVQEDGFIQIGTGNINGSQLAQTTIGISINGRKASFENWDLTLYGAGNYSFGKILPVKRGDAVTCHASRNTGTGSWAILYFIRPRKVPAPWAETAWIPDYANMESTNRITVSDGTWTADRDGFVSAGAQNVTSSVKVSINAKEVFRSYGNSTAFTPVTVLPVKRGDVVLVNASAGGPVCYFIPPVATVPKVINPAYSTTEVDTGKTWIDGKPIYRRVFTETYSIASTTGYAQNTILTNTGIDKITDSGGYIDYLWNGVIYNITLGHSTPDMTDPSKTARSSSLFTYNENLVIRIGQYGAANQQSNQNYKVWAEYTKV